MSNRKEVDLPIDQLSEKSQKLAQKLEELNEERNQKLKAFTSKRLAMKVPTVSVEDLKKTHTLIDTKGSSIEAQFLSANNLDVSLQLSGKSSSLDLPWDKFSEESLALLEGLRRLQQKLIPKTIAAKGNQLEKFSNGPFAGYNTVQQTEFFDAALSASGSYVSIWLKPEDKTFPTRRFTVAFRTRYVVTYEKKNSDGTVRKLPNGKPDIRRSTRSRKIVSFESAPNASMEGGNITLKGTFDNEGTFQYNVSFMRDSILMWSKMKEPNPPKNVSSTSIYISASIPSIVSDSINKTQKEVDKIVGDGYLLETPNSGNARKFPFREKWVTMNNKYKGQKFSGGLKQMRLAGFPFEQNIMNISPLNSKGSGLRREGSYSKVAPYQGFSYVYSSTSKEIAKGQALRISFSRN